jgi:alkane 1-monooxygenase
MKTYVAYDEEGEEIRYRDGKRWLWLASFLYPLVALSGIGAYALTGSEWVLALPLLITYVLTPLADAITGVDRNNPPEEVVPQLEADLYYRVLTWATVPLHFVVLIALAWFTGVTPLSPLGVVLMGLSAGMYSGLGINTGHELGHKRGPFERALADIVLAVPAYGHFRIEHNYGHHVMVSTPEDSASARMGESVYRFALREIPGGIARAWRIETRRLRRKGKSPWSFDNQIVRSWTLTVALQLLLLLSFGWVMIPFLVLHNLFAWWQLTSANYVEHYGLLRERTASGVYQSCEPWHSWNANHIATNLLLFHLERHSDHHAHPDRRYQSLRHFEDLPQLPAGYSAMFLVAYVPPLWFRIMDPRLMALPRIGGDLRKVNVEPTARAALERRWARG